MLQELRYEENTVSITTALVKATSLYSS